MNKPTKLPLFVQKLSRYYPLSYRKALAEADSDALPCYPRIRDGDVYYVRRDERMQDFLRKIGLSDRLIVLFYKDLGWL